MRRAAGENGEEEEDTAVEECRICREEGDADRPLLHPCACSGSIKWCHETCVLQWLQASGRASLSSCETCGRTFTFNPQYKRNAPEVLPPAEFAWLFAGRLLGKCPVVFRWLCVGFTWLYAVPVFSSLVLGVFRHGVTVVVDAGGLVLVPPAMGTVGGGGRSGGGGGGLVSFATWEHGVWVVLACVCLVFLLITVVDFVRQYEAGVFDLEIDQLRQQNLLPPAAAPRGVVVAAAAAPALVVVPEEDEDNEDDDEEEEEEEEEHGAAAAARPLRRDAIVPIHRDHAEEEEENVVRVDAMGLLDIDEQDDDELDDDDDDDLFDLPVALDDDNLDDLDDDEFHDEDSLEDWLGLRGPLSRLVTHALFVSFCVLVIIVLVHALPARPGYVLLRLAGLLPLTTASSSSSYHYLEGPLGLFAVPGKCYEEDKALARLRLAQLGAELAAVVIGTLCELAVMLAGHWLLGAICRHGQAQRRRRRRRQHNVAAAFLLSLLVNTANPRWHQLWRLSRTMCRISKVICVFIFKTFAFPMVLGALIDWAATWVVLGLSEDERVLFAAERPHLAALLLWFAGITHTLLVSVNVILVRDVLHPAVFRGLVRARDQNANQFLPVLLEPCTLQAKRTLVTSLIYASVVVLFIWLPVRFFLHAPSSSSPFLLPLRLTIFFPAVEIPVCLVLFHVWMLTEMERHKPVVVRMQERFFAVACAQLGLTRMLLRVPVVDDGAYAQARQEAQVRAEHMHWLDSMPEIPPHLLQPRERPATRVHARMLGLLVSAWVAWLCTSFAVLALPFGAGRLIGYCLPVDAPWLTQDARWFFVGWYALEEVVYNLFTPNSPARAYYGQLQAAIWLRRARDVKQAALFVGSAAFLVVYAPVLCGLFSVLMVGSAEENFVVMRRYYHPHITANGGDGDGNDVEMVLWFLSELCRSQPLWRTWCAGLPVLAAFSLTKRARVGVWQNWLAARFDLALGTCLVVLGEFILLQLGGITSGLMLWKYLAVAVVAVNGGGGGGASSPLTTVRAWIACLMLVSGTVGALVCNWHRVKATCQRVHRSLRDEKYLLGKRLINFEGGA